MTDDEAKGGSRPRSGAGDPARTQQIPRIEREQQGTNGAPSAKRRPGPAAPAAGSRPSGAPAAKKAAPGQKPAPEQKAAPGQKPGQASSAVKKGAASKPDAQKSAPAPDRAATREQARKLVDKPGSGTGDKPMTAADYARTTRGSAESTAVIPAVKDGDGKAKGSGTSDSAQVAAAASGRGRQASLRLTRIEPWSVTRLAFVVSVAMMIVAVVAVTIFWVVLDLTGVWDQLNGSITNVLSDNEGSFDLTDYLGLGRLVGLTLVLSAVNVVLMTALATIAAHLYNLAAQLLGGVHVTFSDD